MACVSSSASPDNTRRRSHLPRRRVLDWEGNVSESEVTPNGRGASIKGKQPSLFGEESIPDEQRDKLIKGVYKFGEVTSALQKEIPRGDERAAMFWCHLLYETSPYYCVDEETECLSQRGWRRGCDLKVGDRILTMNPGTRVLEWADVERVYRALSSGPMVRVAGRHIDMLVTPDHRWLAHWRYGDRWEWVETKDLKASHSIPLTAKPGMPEENGLSDDLLRVLGWSVTDGSYHRDRGRRRDRIKEIVIGQLASAPECQEIRAALRGAGARWSEHRTGKMQLFNVGGSVKDRIVGLAPDRCIRWDVIASLSGRQAELLRDVMLAGDGSVARRVGRSDPWVFSQSIGPRLDVFQAITALSGKASYQHPVATSGFGKKPVGTVTVKQMARVQWGHQKPRTANYEGCVWCPTTKNGTFVARRRGKTHITGNCWKRVLVTAAEDIGLAAPHVVDQVINLAIAWRLAKERSYFVSAHHISMAVMLLCRAPKSTEVEDLQTLTLEAIKAGERRPILEEHRDAHTQAGKAAGKNWSDWYSDRHRVLGVPVNPYTEELWRVKPEWHPDRATGKKAAG